MITANIMQTDNTPGNTEPAYSIVIDAERKTIFPDLMEVWRYRDLLVMLCWRDISSRYKQSFIGYGWAILRPLIQVTIFTLVFSMLVKVKTDTPYPLFSLTGMIPWMFFSTSLGSITNSVAASSNLLSKVYFPRLILPLVSIMVAIIEMFLQFIILLLLFIVYQKIPSWQIIFIPLFAIQAILTAFAFGLWLTLWNIKFRDIGQLVPFIIQIWMYMCPIIYPISLVPEKYRAVYSLNPMVGVIEGFRWCVLGGNGPDFFHMLISSSILLAILCFALIQFHKMEKRFADYI